MAGGKEAFGMTYYTESEERRKRLRDIPGFPDPWDLLSGMINPMGRSELQRQTILKIQELIEKEGFDIAHRVMASVLGYEFAKDESAYYRFGHFPLFRKTIHGRKIHGNYVDHFYGLKRKDNGVEYVVLEPYGITAENIRRLLDQCDENNLDFSIRGDSQHFPGLTIKIVIGKKRKENRQEEVSGMKTRRLEEGDA